MAQSSNGCSALDNTMLDSIPVELPPQRRMVILILLALAILLHVAMAGWGPIGNQQEGWDTGVARQLYYGRTAKAISENWGVAVQPSLASLLTAQSFRWLGTTEFAARLPSALAILGICFTVYMIAERLGGMNRGLVAGIVTVTTSGPLLHGKSVGGGSIFACFLCVGFYACLRMLEQRPDRRKWLVLFWLATTGALVAGGVAGVVVPLAVLLPVLFFFREARMRLRIFLTLPGLALALVAGLTYLAWVMTGHTSTRLVEEGRSAAGFFWMLFPWSVILLVPLLWRVVKILRLREMECGEAMIWSWLAMGFLWVLPTGLHGEWPLSVAALWPATALIAALVWERLNSGLRMLGCILLILAGGLGMIFCGRLAGMEWLHLLQPIWWLSCGVMIAFGVAALIFIRQRHSLAALLALAAAVIPLAFNVMDARARNSWNTSFRELGGVLNVQDARSPTVFLDDRPESVSGFLFYAPTEAKLAFSEVADRKSVRFVVTPKKRLEIWQKQYPDIQKTGENKTHYLLRLPPSP